METAGDKEFVRMRKGDKILETIVAVSPLLGAAGNRYRSDCHLSNLNIGVAVTRRAGPVPPPPVLAKP